MMSQFYYSLITSTGENYSTNLNTSQFYYSLITSKHTIRDRELVTCLNSIIVWLLHLFSIRCKQTNYSLNSIIVWLLRCLGFSKRWSLNYSLNSIIVWLLPEDELRVPIIWWGLNSIIVWLLQKAQKCSASLKNVSILL